MITFTIDTYGIERAVRLLKRFEDEVGDIAAGELIRQIREYADSGVNPNGGAWPQLTKAYGQRKYKAVGNKKPDKKVTGGFLGSIKNRDLFISVDESHMAIAQGLEKKRISFQVAPISAGNVERLLLKRFDEI